MNYENNILLVIIIIVKIIYSRILSTFCLHNKNDFNLNIIQNFILFE